MARAFGSWAFKGEYELAVFAETGESRVTGVVAVTGNMGGQKLSGNRMAEMIRSD